MIGTIDIRLNAAKPNFPLSPFYAFINSPSQVRVVNVPRSIGDWEITAVYVTANYPDNTSQSVACTLTGGCWHGTLPASTATGTSTNGFTITADGVKEDGTTAVTGYVLGKGDVQILDTDGTITPGETTYYIHVLDAQPSTPHKGDAYVDTGSWKVYNGSAWVTLGGAFGSAQYVQYPTTEGGDGKWHRVIISDGAIAYDETGVDEPPTCATQTWVTTQIAAEATARNAAITTAVSTEASARETADEEISDDIEAEATARASADAAEVTARNSAISTAVGTETTARQNADTALGTRIDNEESAREDADTAEVTNRNAAIASAIETEVSDRNTAIATETTARQAAITAEATARQAADESLAADIESEEAARASAVSAEATARANAVSAEASARANADAAEVTARNAAMQSETSRATAAESAIEEELDDEISRATAAETNEAATRAAADATKVSLSGDQNIGGVKTFVSSPVVPTPTTDMQAATKKYADDVVAAEATARQSADSAEVTNRNAAIAAHTSRTDNPHSVTKAQVGLGNCDNTSDADKPVSTATATAISTAIDVSTSGNNLVHKTGTETITGAKTFSASPVVPTPTANMQASTKKYVDDAIDVSTSGNNLVHKSGAETISGVKTFTGSPYKFLLKAANFTGEGELPESNQYSGYLRENSDGSQIGYCRLAQTTSGTVQLENYILNPYQKISGSNPAVGFVMSVSKDGDRTFRMSGTTVTGQGFAAASLPGTSYLDLTGFTLNSAGTFWEKTFTAQKSGWVIIKIGKSGITVPANKYCIISSAGMHAYSSFVAETTKDIYLPVVKGKSVYVGYSANAVDGTEVSLLDFARILYAQGEE